MSSWHCLHTGSHVVTSFVLEPLPLTWWTSTARRGYGSPSPSQTLQPGFSAINSLRNFPYSRFCFCFCFETLRSGERFIVRTLPRMRVMRAVRLLRGTACNELECLCFVFSFVWYFYGYGMVRIVRLVTINPSLLFGYTSMVYRYLEVCRALNSPAVYLLVVLIGRKGYLMRSVYLGRFPSWPLKL